MCVVVRKIMDRIAQSVICVMGIPSVVLIGLKTAEIEALATTPTIITMLPAAATGIFALTYYCCIRPKCLCGDTEQFASELEMQRNPDTAI